MKRKMTFFARGGMCAARARRGFCAGAVAPALAPKRELSAMEPTPTPHCLKKWRRVTSWRRLSELGSVISFSRHEFIEVEHGTGGGEPGFVFAILGAFFGEEALEDLLFAGAWCAAEAEAEELGDAGWFV